MGIWGEGPFDNDSAGDMIIVMMRPIKKVVSTKDNRSASYRYCEARAAARIILLAHGTDILGGPSLETVLRALCKIRSDTEWLESWVDPRTIALRLDVEMSDVLAKMKACKSCRSSKNLDELEALVRSATAISPPVVAPFKDRGSKRRNRPAHLKSRRKKKQ